MLLEKGSADCRMVNSGNNGILHYLILGDQKSNLEIQKELIVLSIKMGANINMKNKYGETPLHKSIMRKNLQMTEFLISQKADINKINKQIFLISNIKYRF